MPSPLKSFHNRCKVGFTISQKLVVSVLVLIYFLSPIDCWPDILPLGYGDDLVALYAMVRVWFSPTLPSATCTQVTPPPRQAHVIPLADSDTEVRS